MAKLVFGMNVSLDGYVDHEGFAPDAELFQHWIEAESALAGSLYGRRIYEIMRYWDVDDPDWSAPEHAFAQAWRAQTKWVVSKSLTEVGPNARLMRDDVGAVARRLKLEVEGEIDVAGPALAGSLTELGLIDEYRLYFHPVVLGRGVPFFAGPRPRLRPTGSRHFGDVIRLDYVPA